MEFLDNIVECLHFAHTLENAFENQDNVEKMRLPIEVLIFAICSLCIHVSDPSWENKAISCPIFKIELRFLKIVDILRLPDHISIAHSCCNIFLTT